MPDSGTRQVGLELELGSAGPLHRILGLAAGAGIRNLFDADPPFTLQGTAFQAGFNPQVASPLGRAFYLRASVAFQPL